MKLFPTKSACVDYINRNNLNAIPKVGYSKAHGGVLGWYVYYLAYDPLRRTFAKTERVKRKNEGMA